MKPYVIGINGSFHDASVCVLSTEAEEPVLLLAEDRHSGISHHFGFPFQTLHLAVAEVGAENVSAVGYSRDRSCFRSPPQSYFTGILDAETDRGLRGELCAIFDHVDETFPDTGFLPARVEALFKGLAVSGDISVLRKRVCYLLVRYVNELTTEANIARVLPGVPVTGFCHHDTHAATYYASSFDEAAVITWDGRGEFDSTVLSYGKGNTLQRVATVEHPLSLGSFYEVFADFIGLGRVEGPGKLMGLAAYGDDRFVTAIDSLIEVDETGFGFSFHDDFLSYSHSERLRPNERLMALIGQGRERGDSIEEQHTAIAYAVQKTTERVCGQLVSNACKILDTQNVVFSGGLSLNCVMNEKLRATLKVEPFLIPPCGDDGTALGAALLLRQKALEDRTPGDGPAQRLRYHNSYGTKNDLYGRLFKVFGRRRKLLTMRRIACDLAPTRRTLGTIHMGYYLYRLVLDLLQKYRLNGIRETYSFRLTPRTRTAHGQPDRFFGGQFGLANEDVSVQSMRGRYLHQPPPGFKIAAWK